MKALPLSVQQFRLDQLKLGQEGIITRIIINDESVHRLEEIGFLEGRKVKMKKIAPLGDPLEVSILNSSFCLRKKDAESIIVHVEDSGANP